MEADKMKEIFKHFPDLENGWKEMEEKLKAEPAEREMLSLKFREMLQREGSKESLVESEFTKAKMAESDLKVMKANKAPKKLYVDVRDNLSDSILYGFTQKRTDEDIEYIRTDAFIEKAIKYLYDYNQNIVKKHGAKAVLGCSEFTINVEDFKNYMKGE